MTTDDLLKFLSEGPATSSQIEERFGVTGAEVHKAARTLKRMGILASGQFGYSLDVTKIPATIEHMESRAKDMLRTAQIMRVLNARNQMGLPL